jgi:acyl-coenzyme A thioesterase PaaI-like protein
MTDAAERTRARGSDEPSLRTGKVVQMPHNCFACGTLNLHGMQLELNFEGETCWTELRLRPDFEGWEGVAHGGIVSTLLDEVMAWAIAAYNVWAVTAKMSVEFRGAVPIGKLIRAEGRVVENRRRAYTTEASLIDVETGKVLARANALFVPITNAEHKDDRFRFRMLPDEFQLEASRTAGAEAATGTENETAEADKADNDGRSAE